MNRAVLIALAVVLIIGFLGAEGVLAGTGMGNKPAKGGCSVGPSGSKIPNGCHMGANKPGQNAGRGNGKNPGK